MLPHCIADHAPNVQYRHEEQGFFYAGSSIPLAQLLYAVNGELRCVCDGREYHLPTGTFLLLPQNQWHMCYAEPKSAPVLLHLTFSATWDSFVPIIETAPSPTVSAFLQQIMQEYHCADDVSREMIHLLLNQLLLTLYREGRFTEASPLKGEEAIISRTLQLICSHARQRITVPMVAKKAQISPSYLTALFQKHLSVSPGECIRRVKLQESKEMIRSSNMNFTEIAAALQYSTVHQFSRQFKEKFGITPTEYAKTVR